MSAFGPRRPRQESIAAPLSDVRREILASRDRRQEMVEAALASGRPGCLLFLGTNVPGARKNRPELLPIFDEFEKALSERAGNGGFPVLARGTDALGPFLLARVLLDPAAFKRATVLLEESAPRFRLIDADIYAGDRRIGREELGLCPRACLICQEPARECILLGRHRPGELEAACDTLLDG